MYTVRLKSGSNSMYRGDIVMEDGIISGLV